MRMLDNREDERLKLIERVENCFVLTPQIKKVFDTFDELRLRQKFAASKGQNNCMVVGPSGVGKTQVIKAYCNRPENQPYTVVEEDARVTKMPVLRFDMPSPYSITKFYEELLKSMGVPVPRQINGIKVLELIDRLGVEAIIIDEAQSILYARGINVVEGMEALKSFSNQTKASIFLVGVPNLSKLIGIDFQYYRRFRHLELTPFKDVKSEFVPVIKSIVEKINAPFDLGLSSNINLLHALFKMSFGLFSETMEIIKAILSEAGLYKDSVKLSDIQITPNLFEDTYIKIHQGTSEPERERKYGKMNDLAECMVNSKFKSAASKREK